MGIQALMGKLQALVRYETFSGRRHLVSPVVLLTEGVHVGMSGRALFYPAGEIARFPGAWDGRPVASSHPMAQDEEGKAIAVSANSPEGLQEESIGVLFGTWYDEAEKKLRSEIWVDLERARRKDPGLLARLERGEPIEISTGLFGDDEEVGGVWNGESYVAILHNYRPDHLALLPYGVGACSWQDGCGVRTNQGGEDVKKNTDLKSPSNNVRTQARTPTFDGTSSGSWAAVSKGFGDYIGAFAKAHDMDMEDMPAGMGGATPAMKRWMAAHSLLGDPEGSTLREVMMFPVVSPDGKLNEGALRAVLGGRGSQADIPAKARKAAQKKARALLTKHFGMEENADVGKVHRLLQSLSRFLGKGEKELSETLGIEENEEFSHDTVRGKIQDLLNHEDSYDHWHYVREVFDAYFVCKMMGAHGESSHLYQRSYTVDADGNVTIGEEAAEVREKREYVPVTTANEEAREPGKNSKEVKEVDKEKTITALIANQGNGFAEGDRPWLLTLSDDQIGKMGQPGKKPEIAPQANCETCANKPAAAPKANTVAEYVAQAPPEIRSPLLRAVRMEAERKNALIEGLLANEKNQFSKEMLAAKDVDELEALTALAGASYQDEGPAFNFAGQGGGYLTNRAPEWDVPVLD